MLYEIMNHIHNYFPVESHEGRYEISDSTISLPFLIKGQYFLIEGSVLNDGVYRYPCTELEDEAFDGCITALKPPRAFLDLASEIETFAKKNAPSAYQSESFGGYSYSKATNASGSIADWHTAFAERLNVWRKV